MDRIEQRLAKFAPASPPEALRQRIERSAEQRPWELNRLWSTLQWAVLVVLVTYLASMVSETQQRSKLYELRTQARAQIDPDQTTETIRQQVSEVLDDSGDTELADYFVAQAEEAQNRQSLALGSAERSSIWSESMESDWY